METGTRTRAGSFQKGKGKNRKPPAARSILYIWAYPDLVTCMRITRRNFLSSEVITWLERTLVIGRYICHHYFYFSSLFCWGWNWGFTVNCIYLCNIWTWLIFRPWCAKTVEYPLTIRVFRTNLRWVVRLSEEFLWQPPKLLCRYMLHKWNFTKEIKTNNKTTRTMRVFSFK